MRLSGLAVVLSVGLLTTPLAAKAAQESPARPRVAFLGAESQSTNQHFLDAFRQGMLARLCRRPEHDPRGEMGRRPK